MTKILATIGPVSEGKNLKYIVEKSEFIRLNLSHNSIAWHNKNINKIKKIDQNKLILVDIPGIKPRTLNSKNLKIKKGETVKFGKDKSTKNNIIFFTEGHDSLIRTAYNIFKDKPIFGHGPKMFRVKCKNEKYAVGISPCMTHPHNFYVQLLAETGFIGFLFLLTGLYYVLSISLKQFKSIIFKQKRPLSDYQVCLLAGILITVWPISPNGNFFNNWLMVVYCLPIGFYLQSIYSKKFITKEIKKN